MAAPTPTPAPRARGRSSAGARVPARPGARPTNLILDSFGGSQKMNDLKEANKLDILLFVYHLDTRLDIINIIHIIYLVEYEGQARQYQLNANW